MKTLLRPLLLLAAGILAPAAGAADLTGSYNWKPLKIGGGGWVVGMDIHPTEKDLMYVRTDVSGAYRWEPQTETWKQIVTAESLPAAFVGYSLYRGADSVVSAPADPGIAYMAYQGEIFRSTNRGDKWEATGFARQKVKMEPNGEGRQEGERLAVDPRNSDIVYYASVANGLWRTQDAGKTWTKVEGIPAGEAPHGVNTVVFDPKDGAVKTPGGKRMSYRLYVTVDKQGVFQSTDGGETWSSLSGQDGPPVAARLREAAIGPDRTYYITATTEGQTGGSIWKRSAEGKWTDITPEGGLSFSAIAVDPRDPKHLVALVDGGKAFDSTNQGETWNPHGFKLVSPGIKWLGEQENYWLSVGELAFAPDGRLWFAEGFGVWYVDDLGDGDIAWQEASKGIEETCGNDIIAPPGGAPVGAMWDVGTFRFGEPDVYNADRGLPYFMSAWALDWCPADPEFLVAVFRSHLGLAPHINESGYSTDGGKTWTMFPAVQNKSVPTGLEYGVIAVSANSPDKIVWAPATNKLPYYTADRGATWQQSSFGGPETTGFGGFYGPLKALAADRVQPDTFYFYRWEDGAVYRSTDAGATFAKQGGPVANRFNSILKADPTHAGHLWFAEGSQDAPVGGLWRSTDGGGTWTEVPGIDEAFNFGFGKAKEDGGYATVYVAGKVGGRTGIYRSTDEGATWDQVGGYPLGIFDWIDAMDGDKDVFGKVYVAFTSAGFAYGEPAKP